MDDPKTKSNEVPNTNCFGVMTEKNFDYKGIDSESWG